MTGKNNKHGEDIQNKQIIKLSAEKNEWTDYINFVIWTKIWKPPHPHPTPSHVVIFVTKPEIY